jgi:hypothetical protein
LPTFWMLVHPAVLSPIWYQTQPYYAEYFPT